jgi:hypothetical protein
VHDHRPESQVVEGGRFVSRTINQDKGNKRRVRRIRWTRGEMVTAILLLLVLAMESVLVTLWLMGHSVD